MLSQRLQGLRGAVQAADAAAAPRRTHPLAHSFAAAAPSPARARARPLAPSVFYTRTVMSASLKLRGGPEGREGALRWEATGRTIIIGLQSRK